MSFRPAARVIECLPDGRVLIEVMENLAIGEIIRFKNSRNIIAESVLTYMENEQGSPVYLAGHREKVTFFPRVFLQKEAIIEKSFLQDCLHLEMVIDAKQIFYLSGLLEGLDNMAVLSTLDSSQGLVRIIASPFFIEEIHGFVTSLAEEMPLKIISEKMISSLEEY